MDEPSGEYLIAKDTYHLLRHLKSVREEVLHEAALFSSHQL